LWSYVKRDCGHEGSGHEEGCPLPRIIFYFAFKMVHFGAFWADLLTMRDTCDTITNTAAVALDLDIIQKFLAYNWPRWVD